MNVNWNASKYGKLFMLRSSWITIGLISVARLRPSKRRFNHSLESFFLAFYPHSLILSPHWSVLTKLIIIGLLELWGYIIVLIWSTVKFRWMGLGESSWSSFIRTILKAMNEQIHASTNLSKGWLEAELITFHILFNTLSY